MVKHILKILRCKHRKVFKVFWPFFNIMHEKVQHISFDKHNALYEVTLPVCAFQKDVSKEEKLTFLFSHFFLVSQKVL